MSGSYLPVSIYRAFTYVSTYSHCFTGRNEARAMVRGSHRKCGRDGRRKSNGEKINETGNFHDNWTTHRRKNTDISSSLSVKSPETLTRVSRGRREERSFPKIRSVHIHHIRTPLNCSHFLIFLRSPLRDPGCLVVSFHNERIYEIVSFRKERE